MKKLTTLLLIGLLLASCGKSAGDSRIVDKAPTNDDDLETVSATDIAYFEGPLTNLEGQSIIEFNKNISQITYTYSTNIGSTTNASFPLGTVCEITYVGKFAILGVTATEREILGNQRTLQPEMKIVYTVESMSDSSGSTACTKYVDYTNESIQNGSIITKTSYIKKYNDTIVDLTNDIYFKK